MRKKLTIFLVLALIIATITSCSSRDVQQTDVEKTTDVTVSATDATVTTTENSLTTTENDANSEFSQVEVVDSGYTATKAGNYTVISFASIIKNPNDSHAIRFPAIYVTARSDDNKVLTTQSFNLMWIAAGDTITYGNTVSYEGELPASVEITAENNDDAFYYVEQNGSDIIYSEDLVISNISENKGSYSTTYTGEITNNSEYDKGVIEISIIYKKGGKLIGGESTHISNLNAGQTKPFEKGILSPPENYDSYEIHAHSAA